MQATTTHTPGLKELEVPGKLLEGNPLGDPARRQMPVWLPPSYDGKKRFPVLFLLAGFASSGRSFANYSFGRPSIPEMAETMVRDGVMQECIIVMPDCMTRYGGSQYVDSTATGPYQSYLTEEVIPFVDSSLMTLPDRRHRGILGKSSGGFGALRLGMLRADLFGAIGCHSGDMAFELCYRPNFPIAARILEQYGGSKTAFYERWETSLKAPSRDFTLLDILAMAAAYSPDPQAGPLENMRLPFNPDTAELIDDVWLEWKSFDPVEMVEKEEYRKALTSLELLYLDCGSQDEYHLQFAHRILSRKLSDAGISHRYEEFPDSHMGTSYRYAISFPALSGAIAP